MSARQLATHLIHAGADHSSGAVVPPIHPSANYLQTGAASYGDVRYLRLSNSPQQTALGRKLAVIEGAEDALAFASGMAAISTALLSVLSSGDHVLVQRNVYGGTATLLQSDLTKLGIAHTSVDATRPDTWAAAVRPTTRAMYVESVSNPLLEIAELEAVTAFCSQRDLVSLIDNTFLSPVGLRPLSLGFDLVLHSATKYLNGHSDLVAGVVAGSSGRVDAVRHLQNHLGGCLDPHSTYLLDRGLKTLHLRVPYQAATAARLAEMLHAHPEVAQVRYPGLSDHPGHATATRLFSTFGAMVTFETLTDAAAEAFIQRVRIPLNAASLGGLESLVVRPSRSSHLGLEPAERHALGITDRLIRVSVGAEDADDLLDDFRTALGGDVSQ